MECIVCGKEISEEEADQCEGMCHDCFVEYYQQLDDWESEEFE